MFVITHKKDPVNNLLRHSIHNTNTIGMFHACVKTGQWEGNKAIHQVLGLPKIDLHHLDEFAAMQVQDEEKQESVNFFYKAGSGEIVFRRDYHIIRPIDGEEAWISSHAKLITDPYGEPIRLDGITIDITSSVKLMQAKQKNPVLYFNI